MSNKHYGVPASLIAQEVTQSGNGGLFISDTAVHTGSFVGVRALTTAVVALVSSDLSGTLTSVTIPAGSTLTGNFSSITLASGSVEALY